MHPAQAFVFGGHRAHRQANDGVRLVNRAIGRHAWMIFGDLSAAKEPGRPVIARSCVLHRGEFRYSSLCKVPRPPAQQSHLQPSRVVAIHTAVAVGVSHSEGMLNTSLGHLSVTVEAALAGCGALKVVMVRPAGAKAKSHVTSSQQQTRGGLHPCLL